MVLEASNSFQMVLDRVTQSARHGQEGAVQRLCFRAMSTECRVDTHGVPADRWQAFQEQVLLWVAEFEAKYSRFIPDSLISRINESAGEQWVEVDAETDRLLALCHDLVFITRGAFDPTALPLIRLWNWKAVPPVVPSAADIERARALVGWRKVQRAAGKIFLPEPGMCLDFGGIGKEYAVDRVTQLAAEFGLTDALVDFGADIRVLGHAPGKPCWHIGLDDPKKPGQCWTGVAVTDHGVTTSGDYLRSFTVNGRRYGHIIDPRTGYPVDNGCEAVSIIASSCTIAGVLSTTAFILGPEEGLRLIQMQAGAEGAITTKNNRFTTRKFYEYTPV